MRIAGRLIAEDRKDLYPPITLLAENLGARSTIAAVPRTKWSYLEHFELTVSGVEVRGTPKATRRGLLLGAILTVTLPTPLSAAPITARHERWADRIGKRLRINRETQTGDPLVDRAVYFETDAADTTVQHLFSDTRSREVLLELLSGVVETVLVSPEAQSHTVTVEIPVGRFAELSSIGRAADGLVRLGALLAETMGPVGPYGRGGLVALPAAARMRTGRGFAVAAVALAAWVGLFVISPSPTFGWRAFGIGVGGGSVLWFVLVAVAIALLRGRSTSLRTVTIAAIFLLGAVPFGGRIGELLNAALDGGPRHREPGRAVERIGSKGAVLHEVQLDSTGASVAVGGELVEAVAWKLTPSRVRILVGDGALGAPFVAGLEPSSP